MSANSTGEKNHFYGKPSPFKGKKHTKEAKAQMRQSHLGKKRSEETKAKMREKALAKAVAEENLAAANSTPTSLSTLLDAVVLQ